jgi:hypothetical protein
MPTEIVNRTYLADAAERVIATFAVAFLGLLTPAVAAWLGGGAAPDWRALVASATGAGIIAAWDVLKVLIAKFVGSSNSASFVE